MKVFKVGSKSDPGKLAGAISATLNEGENIKLECIGAGAISQAIKGVATARGFLTPSGNELYIKPYFSSVVIEDEEKTAMVLQLILISS